MSSMKSDLGACVRSAAAEWKKAKKREDRVSTQSLARMRHRAPPRITVRNAAFYVMEQAYIQASSNGRYYANARQIMYAARPRILELTGEDSLNDVYFTQTLLKDYLEEYRPNWKVVWDARGHITEPHTREVVGLGGVEVIRYTANWTGADFDVYEHMHPRRRIDTSGPSLRFGAALFIEKEGFDHILKDAGLAERYDLAIMSTKGIPVKAACDLNLRFQAHDVKVLVLHDFDKDGFKIAKTLREGTRLSSGSSVIDIGLRLEDVEGLQTEPVTYPQSADPRYYLRDCGATQGEWEFLVNAHYHDKWMGERVELNALTSQQLIDFLERKLSEHGIEKVVPDDAALARAYRRAAFLQTVERETESLRDRLADEEIDVPRELNERVKAMLQEDDTRSWDEAIWDIVCESRGDL